MESATVQSLVEALKMAAGLVDDDALRRDVAQVVDRVANPTLRIAVFAPFNYGKSTLLNAVLGERALPIDLIPTTGAAILVKYGEALASRVRLVDGTEICEPGTEVLKRFAILDDQRRMRGDVAAVEVFCPHPLLKLGVEFLDLPGTNDREAQDRLVKESLLTADLVVQVLDGRKLMTLGEREHLRDWLLDRGIETVVFVVNFLNLLEIEDQKQVASRLRFVAESFRANLPAGVSNLYRVDALPALRARLKGDLAGAQASGLLLFASALQTIVQSQHQQRTTWVSRTVVLAQRAKQALQEKQDAIAADLLADDEKRLKKLQIQQRAQELLTQGFAASVKEFRQWLALPRLLEVYQEGAALALQRDAFRIWERGELRPPAIDHQQAIVKWVRQACEFFDQPRPTQQLLVGFPNVDPVDAPELTILEEPGRSPDLTPTAIATGLGWVLGGPVGAAVFGGTSYLFNRNRKSSSSDATLPSPAIPPLEDCLEAAHAYLNQFSEMNLAILKRYEATAVKVMQFQPTSPTPTHQHHHLQLLQNTLEQLEQLLQEVGGK